MKSKDKNENFEEDLQKIYSRDFQSYVSNIKQLEPVVPKPPQQVKTLKEFIHKIEVSKLRNSHDFGKKIGIRINLQAETIKYKAR